MHVLRLITLVLGGLLIVAAFGSIWGVVDSVLEGDGPSTAGDWLGVLLAEAILISLAVGFFFGARAIGRGIESLNDDAAQSPESGDLLCPQCRAETLVQGHYKPRTLLSRTYTARCRNCARRVEVSREEWRGLPLAEGGDAHETPDDRQYRVARAPMTPVQVVFVLMGIIGSSFAFFYIAPDDVDATLLGLVVLPVAYGCWWLGRLVSRPRH